MPPPVRSTTAQPRDLRFQSTAQIHGRLRFRCLLGFGVHFVREKFLDHGRHVLGQVLEGTVGEALTGHLVQCGLVEATGLPLLVQLPRMGDGLLQCEAGTHYQVDVVDR